MKRFLKWVGVTAAVPVALASICAALLYFPPFQNWAANKVASYASEKTGMEISVDKVRLEFPLKLGVEGVKVIKQNDSIPQQKDTVADIKKVVADVKMLPLFKKKVEIDQLDFHDAKINTTDFIDDTRVKGTIGRLSVKSHGIDLNTNEIRIDDAQITDAKVDVALSDTVPDDTTKTEVPWKIKVDNLNIERSDVQVTLPGDSLQMKAHLGKATVKDGNFDLKESSYQVGKLDIKDGRVQYDDKTKTHARSGFDSNHIDAKDVNVSMENISYKEPKLSANLKSASFKEKSGIDVRDVSGKLAMDDKKLTLKNATVKTPDSSISADFDMDMNTFDVKNAGKLNANIHAKIGKQDLMKYMGDTPAGFRKKWPNYPLSIDGVVKGNMDRLDFKGLNVKLPTAFQAKASGHAENLNDLKRLKADVNFDAKAHDMGFVQELLPNDLKKDIRIPKNISMKGNVKANGDKYSGNITMNEGGGNMKATFSYDNAKQSYTADVDANRLQLQHFAPNYGLSPFTGNVELKGQGTDFTSPKTRLNAKANIKNFKYGGYDLNNISADATMENGRTKAKINSNNPLLKGLVDLDALISKDHLRGTIMGDVGKIDLKKLGLVDNTLSASGCMHLDFDSDMKRCHRLRGLVSDLTIHDERKYYRPDDMVLDMFSCPDTTHAVIDCADFHLDMDASHYYEDLLKSANNIAAEVQKQYNDRHIDQLSIRQQLPNARVWLSSGKDNFIVQMLNKYGYGIKDLTCSLTSSPLEGLNGQMHVDSLIVDSILLDTVHFAIRSDSTNIFYSAQVRNAKGNPQYVFNALADGGLTEKGTYLTASVFDSKDQLGVRMGVSAEFADSGMVFHSYGEQPILGYKQFAINDDNYVYLGKDMRVSADVVLKAKDGTGVQIYTNDDNLEALQDLTVSVNKIDIERILSVIPYTPAMSGMLSGDFHVIKSEDELSVSSSMDIKKLIYEQNPMGDVASEFVYMPKSDGSHYIDGILSRNSIDIATVKGIYNSAEDGFLDADLNLLRLPLSMVNGFIPNHLIGFDGYGEGTLSIKGALSKPVVNGEVYLDSAYMSSVPYGVKLRFDNDPVTITNSRLLFENFNMYGSNDSKGESPLFAAGYFDFSDLDHMRMDVRMRAENFQVIDAKEHSKSEVFGKTFVNFMGMMRGELSNLMMRGRLDVLGSTDMTYILRDSPLTTDNQLDDLVKFTNFADTAEVVVTRPPLTGFNMDLTLNIDESAHILCALNADKSNYVDLIGGGELRMQYNPVENLRLTGRYTLSNGEMKYSLPVIPLKTFTIQDGSYIEFNGDAMNPRLNITATEMTKAAVSEQGEQSRMVEFECGVVITKTLKNMGLKFVIDAPQDMTISNELNTMSLEERGKLAVTLLTTGMYLADGNTSAFSMNSALSAFLQSQINGIAGNALRTLDLSFGMDNSTDASGNVHTDYSFKFSKRFWNNRLRIIIGGKLSSGSDVANQNNSFFNNVQFEYRLNQKSSQFLKLFYQRDSYDWLEGNVSEYGGGFIWRRKLQYFKEIFQFKDKPNIVMPPMRRDTVTTNVKNNE